METCKECESCSLYGQKPVSGNGGACGVFFVGLSPKTGLTEPLPPDTVSGSVIHEISRQLELPVYRTNLVKCTPLDTDGMLRYPLKSEEECCMGRLFDEIERFQPLVIFLLGKRVQSAVFHRLGIKAEKTGDKPYEFRSYKHNGVWYVPIQHPAYIMVYARQEKEKYINGICKAVHALA